MHNIFIPPNGFPEPCDGAVIDLGGPGGLLGGGPGGLEGGGPGGFDGGGPGGRFGFVISWSPPP